VDFAYATRHHLAGNGIDHLRDFLREQRPRPRAIQHLLHGMGRQFRRHRARLVKEALQTVAPGVFAGDAVKAGVYALGDVHQARVATVFADELLLPLDGRRFVHLQPAPLPTALYP